MEVILMERVEKLGQMGDVVSVKPGYARNFLLPQRKALRATKGNMERFENQRVHLEADNLERRQEAEKVSEKLQGLTVVLIRQAGESGQLYGSVNTKDLAQAVTEAGIRIERRQVILDKVIKSLGLYPVRIQLHPEVAVEVSANVARSDEEAEAQAKAGRMISAEELREAEEAQEAEIEAVVEAVVMEEEEKTASNDETQSEEVEDKET
jgi:large subunit ribosomal protein L9